MLGLTVALAFGAFRAGVALDLFVPLAVGLLTWLGATGVRLLTEGRYNRWLEGAFARYLAPSVIEALKQDPGLLALGGTTRELTVLFSDVAGFTKLSERLKPAQVSTLLNEYLTRHCDAVFATEGVVDKFIGDAVMAFWNDPVPQPDHALRACRTALAVQAAMPGFEPVWRGLGLSEFEVRIGLNSGTAVVGNMGSRQRFDYTALGDTVNLASRLEGANKAFGTSILLGDAARRLAGDAVLVKPLARLRVVGKEQPVAVHELVALAAEASEAQRAHVLAFTRASDAARAGDLETARAALAGSPAHPARRRRLGLVRGPARAAGLGGGALALVGRGRAGLEVGGAWSTPRPPGPPTSRPRGRALPRAWAGARSCWPAAGTVAYVALLGVPWSRETGLVAFVPLALACGLALRAWRGDRRLLARLPALLVWLLAAGFVWVFFVVARLPAASTFETLARAPDVVLARAEGTSLRLSEVAARGPVLLVFFRGHW